MLGVIGTDCLRVRIECNVFVPEIISDISAGAANSHEFTNSCRLSLEVDVEAGPEDVPNTFGLSLTRNRSFVSGDGKTTFVVASLVARTIFRALAIGAIINS